MYKLFAVLALCLAATIPGLAQDKVPLTDKNSKGIAIKGYDTVAYFDQSQPVKGAAQFSYDWNGAKWLFSSAAHRDTFAKDPAKYAPQYGGYCAYGVSQGHAVEVDPTAWKIVDGKLYLNNSKAIQQEWFKDIPGHITEADQNWPTLHQ